jgi:dTMP kinase
VNRFASGGLEPDRTLLLRVEPAVGRARQAGRGAADRMERSPEDFFSDVADAYDRLAAQEPQRVRALDAGEAPDAVLARALEALEGLLPDT